MRRWVRAAILCAVVAAVALALCAGLLLTRSVESGMESASNRLGADILVVARGYRGAVTDRLLVAAPYPHVMVDSTASDIAAIPVVMRATTQVYGGDLALPGSPEPVPVIGIDPATDFVVTPWLGGTPGPRLQPAQAYVGSRIEIPDGTALDMLGEPLAVVGRLEETGTVLDRSIVTCIDAARRLSRRVERTAVRPEGVRDNEISTVLLRAKAGVPLRLLADSIERRFEVADVVMAGAVFEGAYHRLVSLRWVMLGLAAAFWIVALGVIFAVFSLSLNERRREFGLLRGLGATRKRLFRLVVCEAMLVSAAGAAIGTGLAGALVIGLCVDIARALALPFVTPPAPAIALLLGISLVASVAVGPLAAMHAARKASRTEPYLAIREGE